MTLSSQKPVPLRRAPLARASLLAVCALTACELSEGPPGPQVDPKTKNAIASAPVDTSLPPGYSPDPRADKAAAMPEMPPNEAPIASISSSEGAKLPDGYSTEVTSLPPIPTVPSGVLSKKQARAARRAARVAANSAAGGPGRATQAQLLELVSHSAIGYLDGVTVQGEVVGWALDPATPARSIEVRIFVDGPPDSLSSRLVATAHANQKRPDLNRAGYEGDHGFRVAVATDALLNGKERRQIYACGVAENGGLAVLTHSPQSLPLVSDPAPRR